MRSLQVKFTLALLLTSLTAVLMVGVVTRSMMLRKFNQNAMEQSFKTYQTDLQAYIATYGSWEQAQAKLPFREWMRISHRPMPPGSRNQAPLFNGPAPTRSMESAGIEPDHPGTAPPPPPGQLEPSERGVAGDGPQSPRPLPPPPTAPPPPPLPDEGGMGASFRFVILDAQGRVLLGPPEMRHRTAPDDWRAQAQPVVVNGKTAVLVVPYGEPNLTAQDMANLSALKEALIRGVAVAMLMAITMGLFLGHRLGGNLRELTSAIEAVGAGRLRQRVKVHSQDEVGVLAEAFNRMSEELAQAHEKLQQTHTQVSEQAARLQELSVRDELTQLHNRRYFDMQVAQIFAQSQRYERPLTVMIGDLDHFKRINDSFSHAVGDDVLRHVSAILKKFTRQSDVVARYGGEEFVIAFPETPLPQAMALCERLRQQIEAYPWNKIQPDLRVTMSMGLNDDLGLKSSEKMLAAADELLYNAKSTGRNRLCAPVAEGAAQLQIVGPKAA
jgi:two-component system cell cycle response regulator